MRKSLLVVLMVAVLVAFGTYTSAEELKMKWSNGIRFQSEDKSFSFKLGGRIMNDWAWFDVDEGLPEVEDGTEFRRARLYLAGTIYDSIDFKAQYDFAGSNPDFKDVYIGYKLPRLGK